MALGAGAPLEFDERGRADLGRWGVLRSSAGDSYIIQDRQGKIHELEQIPSSLVGLCGWLDERRGLLVVGSDRSDDVLVTDLVDGADVLTVSLVRDPDVGMRRLRVFPVVERDLGCLTETDLFVLDSAGRLRWRWTHDDPTLSLVDVHGSVVELESLLPDLDPQDATTIFLDAETGSEVAGEK